LLDVLLEAIDRVVMGAIPVIAVVFVCLSILKKGKNTNAYNYKDSLIFFCLVNFLTATMMLNAFTTYYLALFWLDVKDMITYPDYVPMASFIIMHFFFLMVFFTVSYVLKHIQDTQIIPGEGTTYVRLKTIIKQKFQRVT
jgi:hypothetical protein